jgi:hypothetical protein
VIRTSIESSSFIQNKTAIKRKTKRNFSFLKSTTTDLQQQYFVGEKQKVVSMETMRE